MSPPDPSAVTEPNHYGCVVPADLLYDVEMDVWIRLDEDGTATVGMTDPAQTRCGKLVTVAFRKVGKEIKRGRGLATVESAKWVGPIPSPLSGEILAVNDQTFREDLLMANRDPYGRGWFVKLRPSDLEAERALLVDGPAAFEAYKRVIDENEIRCFRCADPPQPGEF